VILAATEIASSRLPSRDSSRQSRHAEAVLLHPFLAVCLRERHEVVKRAVTWIPSSIVGTGTAWGWRTTACSSRLNRFGDPRVPSSGQSIWSFMWDMKGKLVKQDLFLARDLRRLADALAKGKVAIALGRRSQPVRAVRERGFETGARKKVILTNSGR